MQAPAKGTKRRSISYAKWGYIFIAPFFIAFAIFQLIPLASTIYYSFFEYYRSGLKVIGPNFTGLSNYVKLLSLDLPKYLGNTMLLWLSLIHISKAASNCASLLNCSISL